jgi:hypothetical protein
MFKSLLYKEWIKLRLYWWLLFAANLAFAGFLALSLRHVYQLHEAVVVWSNWISKGYLFFRPAQYGPLLIGVVLACLQFFPEILNKRLRLVLHLPLGEERAVGIHLAAGLLLLGLILAPGLLVVAGIAGIYFPAEFQSVIWFTYGPWLLAGFVGYLITAALLIEPTWLARVFYLLFGAALLRLLYLDGFYNAYLRILPWVALGTAALFIVPLLSTHRFGKGYGS